MKMAVILCVIVAASMTVCAAPVSIDATSLKFIPPDAGGIAFIDVAALFKSPLLQDVFKNELPGKVPEVISGTGLDIQREISSITVAKLGAGESLVIVQGPFDRFKVEQYFRDTDKTPEAYLGQTLYHDSAGLVVILNNVILSGKTEAIHKAIDQMQLPGSTPLRSDLMAAVQAIEAGNQVWGVGDFSVGGLKAIDVQGAAPVRGTLQSLKSGTLQLAVDTGVHLRVTGNFMDAERARTLADLAGGALALARLQFAKQQPDLVPLLDGIQVSSDGMTLSLRLDASGESLKKLNRGLPR